MTQHELAEIAVAAHNVNGTDRAAIVMRVDKDGYMYISSYGEPDALFFAYGVVSKAWKDYKEGVGDIVGVTEMYKIDE